MNFLYHITIEKYLHDILRDGLLINTKNNGFIKKKDIKLYWEHYSMQPIFLTKDVNYIIQTQLTESFITKNKPYILKILVDNLKIEGEYDYLKKKYEYYKNYNERCIKDFSKSFICRENIDKKFINNVYICYEI